MHAVISKVACHIVEASSNVEHVLAFEMAEWVG